MAVKKKPAVKKAAAKKRAVKKTAAKKSAAKKTVKKSAVKKSAAKKTVKKSAAKKTVKKSAAKKTVKKSAAKKRATSASSIVIPPVPSSSSLGAARVDFSSTPKVASQSAPVKPSAPASTPKQGASSKVFAAIIVGIILLAVVVVTRPDSGSDDATPAPAASASPMASEEPSAEPTSAPVTSVEAPDAKGDWKDSSQSVMVISWKELTATDGLTGFRVEISSNSSKNWTSFAEVSSTESSVELSKTSEDGSTSIRVVALYSDGQEVIGNEFGFGVTLS